MSARALGERIAERRKERGLSQEELARAVGVSRSAVAQWERGFTEPASAHLRKISETLQMPFEYLTAGRGDRQLPDDPPDEVAEGTLIAPDSLPLEARSLLALVKADQEIWKLSTDKIAGAGYRRGDYLLVDLTVTPQAGHFVLAANQGRNIFRLFYPPHLFAVPFSGTVHHTTVDGTTTTIRGVIVARYST